MRGSGAKSPDTPKSALLKDPDVVDVELPSQGGVEQSNVPGALPAVVHHDIEDDLRRAVLDGGSVAIELGSCESAAVPLLTEPVFSRQMP